MVATGGNQGQIGRPLKPQKQAKSVATGCHRLPEKFHGKEGVSGSSPEEGFQKTPEVGGFLFQIRFAVFQRALASSRYGAAPSRSAGMRITVAAERRKNATPNGIAVRASPKLWSTSARSATDPESAKINAWPTAATASTARPIETALTPSRDRDD